MADAGEHKILGLTDPYKGDQACSRVFAHGYTFRWVKGDRYVAVMRGHCVDVRRYLIIRDHLEGYHVHETPQPLVDVIATPSDQWWDNTLLARLADEWALRRPSMTGARHGRV
jgi:hypothetical protein